MLAICDEHTGGSLAGLVYVALQLILGKAMRGHSGQLRAAPGSSLQLVPISGQAASFSLLTPMM